MPLLLRAVSILFVFFFLKHLVIILAPLIAFWLLLWWFIR
jgi:hypothetical protein